MRANSDPTVGYEEEPGAAGSLNFNAIYHAVLDKAWLIALCVAAALFLSFLEVKNATRIYTAKAVLQVHHDKPQIINIEEVHRENFGSIDFLKTVEQTFQSRSLLERVVETNRLGEDPRFVTLAEGEAPPSKAVLISKVGAMVEVKLRSGTRLMDVSAEHPDPEIAALVANSVIQEFVRQNMELRSSASHLATEALRQEADRLLVKLMESKNRLQKYKEDTQFVPAEGGQNSPVQRLREQLEQTKSQRLFLQTEYEVFIKTKGDSGGLLTIPSLAANQTINQLRNDITAQQAEIAKIELRYKHRHPKYIEAHAFLGELQSALARAIVDAGEKLRGAYQNALKSEQELERELEQRIAAAITTSQKAIEYENLQREIDSNDILYKNVLHRMKETTLTSDLDVSKVRVVQQAEVPEFPSKPQKEKILLIGAGLGLFAGLGLVLLLGVLDNSFQSLEEVEDYLRLPVLSTIPELEEEQLDQTRLVMKHDDALSGAESFRSLRTSLAILERHGPHKVYLFTSSLPEEGKTFCALNYSYSLAQQGLRVLLIDCDLRRPEVEQCLLGTYGKALGVSDYLAGESNFEGVTHETGIANFSFTPAGRTVSNPSELLAQNKLGELIQESLAHFDRVVLDTAPIFGVSDTLLLAHRAQVFSLVIRAGKTPRKVVLRALQVLRKAGVPLGGAILNGTSPKGGRDSADPYYDYGYANSPASKGASRETANV